MPPKVPVLSVPQASGRIGHQLFGEVVSHLKRMVRAGDDAVAVAYVADRLFRQVSDVDPGWSFVHFDAPDDSHVFCGVTSKPIVVRSSRPVQLWRVPPPGIWPIRFGNAPCAGALLTDAPNYGDAHAVRQA